MTVTLDTNVLIAAFISRGQCHELFEHVIRHHRVVLSDAILAEFERVLTSKFKINPEDVHNAQALIRSRTNLAQPAELQERVSRDPDDDMILATAKAGSAACIVTGDKDLLVLKTYKGIMIVSPSQFWEFEASQASN